MFSRLFALSARESPPAKVAKLDNRPEAGTASDNKDRFIRDHFKLTSRDPVKVYIPKLTTPFRDHGNKIQRCEIGKPELGVQEKVVMVVGATGSGKTTLINGMLNYLMGAEWTDMSRFKLIEEELIHNQVYSVTQWITAYTIHHVDFFSVPFTLHIVDTPGFGDTSGIRRDQQITEQIRIFFSTAGSRGLDRLDAVGFVAQSSLPRLTVTQKYIFDSILSLFGKDIAENIFLLLTFADGQKPQVLGSIGKAGIPYQKFFKFNNSAWFVGNQQNDEDQHNFDEMFWKMGVSSFKTFMTELEKVDPKSLTLTKEVLSERKNLELAVQCLHTHIKLGLGQLEELKKEAEVLKQHENDIDKNKDFTYEVEEHKMIPVSTAIGQYTTNCTKCNVTCHIRCRRSDDADKENCMVMNNGTCGRCHCFWNLHKNQPFVYEMEVRKVTKTAEDLRKRYEDAMGKKLTAEQLVKTNVEVFEAMQLKVVAQTEQTRKGIARLQAIALRPCPLSTVEYIDLLIQGEQNSEKPGFTKRVEQLYDVRKKAKYMQQLADDGFDPFEEYKARYEEEKNQNNGDGGVWATVKKWAKSAWSWAWA